MWEMYEIHPSLPMKVTYIGYWNAKMGIQVKENKKWIRRHDLEVAKYIVTRCHTVVEYKTE